MQVHIHTAILRAMRGGEDIAALAITKAPGLCDVTAFITFDDKGMPTVYAGEIWDYNLNCYASVTVQSGAATLDL